MPDAPENITEDQDLKSDEDLLTPKDGDKDDKKGSTTPPADGTPADDKTPPADKDKKDLDISDILPDDDKDVKPIKEREDEDVDEDEEKEDEDKKESDEEDEEESTDDEEKDDLKEIIEQTTPEYKEIVKKYPQFFRDFPGMRHTIFRMKAMDRIFTSVDEARGVAEKHDDLLQLEQSILNGDPKPMLAGLKGMNAKAMNKWVDNLLPTLFDNDRESHDRITQRVLSTALRVAERQGRATNNKNLFNSVGHICQFLFGSDKPPETARPSSPELDAERRDLEDRENRLYEGQAREFEGDVMDTGERLLRKEISRGLDPDGVLPGFMKKSIVDAAVQKIGEQLDKDESHTSAINTLWDRAQRAGFSKEAKAKLVAVYFGRAKQLVGPTRRKLVADTIGKSQGGKRRKAPSERRRHITPGSKGGAKDGFRPTSAKEVDWAKSSDLDILEGKATPHK